MDELVNLVSSVGFPIAITIFLLIRFDNILQKMVTSQEKMILVLDRIYDKICKE